MQKILYVNHKKKQCGVYEFGREIATILSSSKKYSFKYCECDSYKELKENYKNFSPDIIIYNYHPTTLGWVNPYSRFNKFNKAVTFKMNAIHVCTMHEVYQEMADRATNKIFDYHIAPDSTLLLKNSLVYKTGRLLPKKAEYVKNISKVPIIGSFGFATPGKGFEKIVELVQKEFDEAIINFNIPYASFGDTDGISAKKLAIECKNLIKKPGIELRINHDYLDKEQLLNFLSGNTINVFLYDDQINRGISSTVDWALAAGRPIAISRSELFRHLFHCRPSICIDNNSLKTIIDNEVTPIQHLWQEYNSETLLWEYERIIDDIRQKEKHKSLSNIGYYFSRIKKRFGLNNDNSNNIWTKSNDKFTYQHQLNIGYTPIDIPDHSSLNRILDNDARNRYKPTIDFFSRYLPDIIAKKIPEANVQQAFVFDTAVRLSNKSLNCKILAVGAFEDTAAEGLKLLNYNIDEIDPILNYDLDTYISKPGVKPSTYDIIISTSVIEHVPNDEQFVKDIAFLLKKGGYGILTCDYNDKYKPGDDIPVVDYRFYTQKDFNERLMKAIPDCQLIDTPKWECENPDFYLAGKYNYTFASFVFQKVR